MSPFKYACLVLALFLSVMSVDVCFAQSVNNKSPVAGSALVSEPIIGVTTGGEFSGVGGTAAAAVAVPAEDKDKLLRSAACGTIGPQDPVQGGDSNFQSPMIPTPLNERPQSRTLPPIPTLLFFTLTITAIAWGLRDMATKRRVTIINAGVVAASVVMAAGFTWSIFNQDEVGYGHFSLAKAALSGFAYIIR